MRDWEQFVQHTPWFVDPGDTIVVGDEVPWPRGGLGSLPRLSQLLDEASLTTVSVSGTPYELIAWGPASERRGWLCDPPPSDEAVPVHETHRLFWSVCGFAPDHAFARVTPLAVLPADHRRRTGPLVMDRRVRYRLAGRLTRHSWFHNVIPR